MVKDRITQYKGIVVGLVCVVALVALFSNTKQAKADYTPPAVIINEIMYNPAADVQTNEFLELYNTTDNDIDLNGWCFTVGIAGCFTTGQTITAHGFVVVSPNSSQTQAAYGLTPTLVYTGALSNGGEVITLQNASHVNENSVNYDDVAPWPTSPDGNGPSLELKDPAIDNTLAASWAASTPAPTPGSVNTAYSTNHAVIDNVSQASNVTSADEVTVTAHVTNTTAVSLLYKLNFDSDQTLAMYDDGNHSDGASGDNVYGATIPAQAAGQLVRYKVSAVHNANTDTKPGSDDSINYYGYAVRDSGVQSNETVLQWFISPSDYDTLAANPEATTQYSCVLAYGDEVFDNAKVDVYGGSSRTLRPKVSLEFELPSGYRLTVPGKVDRSIKEFQLEADSQNIPAVQQTLAWQMAKEMGITTLQSMPIRLQRNGQFHGVYTFIEKFNKDWRQANGYEQGAFYRDSLNKKTRLNEDTSDIVSWRAAMNQPKSTARKDYLLDNNDIPSLINFLAFQAMIRNHDWGDFTNMINYRDSDGTGRWSFLPRDLDLTYTTPTNRNMISPYDTTPEYYPALRGFAGALYQELDLREMYFRRIRTLTDTYYSTDLLKTRFLELFDSLSADLALDYAAWYPDNSPASARDYRAHQMEQEKTLLLRRFTKAWAIPPAQTPAPVVQITHINPAGVGQDEYIQLTNNSSESVDLSGWSVDEIGYTLPSGSVLLAGHSTVLVKDDVAYRSNHPGSYVIGQYANSINTNSSGSLTLKRANGSTAGSLSY